MKNAAIVILAVLVFAGITSCQKTKDEVNKATAFDMNYTTGDITIPSSTLAAVVTGTTQTVEFNTPEISTASASRFTSESTTQDLIEEIKMTKFTISNSSGNLNFLKSINIYIKTSGLGDLLIATKTVIPQNVSTVNADLTDVNIKQFIFKDKIQFKVSVTLIAGTNASGDQKLKTSQTMHVKGKRI
ncbi:hypothetical protein CNR22_10565 [Sphingobacteriaceae bacterium]|nr:hypothetical protein CNR22_10565 [Sphingobacteriaceae bacterium]